MSAPDEVVHYERPVQARATIRGVLLLQLLANGAGAAVVVVYLGMLFPVTTIDDTRQVGLNVLVLGLFLLISLAIAFPLNRVMLQKAMRWVREGRPPTAKERKETLAQPFVQTSSAFVGWVGAAVVFGLVNESNGRRVTFGILLAGLLVSAILYQLLERHFRPIVALAMAGQPPAGNKREVLIRLMLAWWIGSAVPILALALAPLVTPADEQASLGLQFSVVMVLVLVAGGLVMRAAAGSVARSVNGVRDAMAEVEDGNLDVHVAVDTTGEMGRLQAGFNAMVDGLRERRRIQELFGRQVGTDVARHAVEGEPTLGGEVREITALFVDLADFTAFTESHGPEEVVNELNKFFAIVIRVVMHEGGWVNKFEGDAALCIFGAPADQPDHAMRALRAASRLPAEVAALPDAPDVGIGVATGRAVAGHVGTAERYEYTVIGDAVNVASRLTELAKTRATHALCSDDTIRAAGDAAAGWRRAGTVRVKGRRAPLGIFEPAPAETEPGDGASSHADGADAVDGDDGGVGSPTPPSGDGSASPARTVVRRVEPPSSDRPLGAGTTPAP
ncbi:MAG: adenylate/guanylate cyclase domain-containing protein [Acidimicrobiales bacterium]